MQKLKWMVLLAVFLLSGCAVLSPDFEQPTVSVTSFRILPSNNMVPEFEIGLHVLNPNRTSLELLGLTYEVELEGHRVLTGVASELPVIAAYGEGDVLLQAMPDLVSSIRLFGDLMGKPRDKVHFNFSAYLDVGRFLPKIHVEEAGEISFPVAGQ